MANTDPGLVDDIIAYESGQMDRDEIIAFFQKLVNTGVAWELQGAYGRQADQLLKLGLIYDPNFDQTMGE